ncbi:SDR family NAD(P)-dependent oxidoreductase [Roseovarius tibetensis]|uniref:SDR family NAD(P)-dependent oxidoreductase n=1 Tax=Roseovarius tibetensis TaxID=2685897 RepID=UPI003D7FC6A4
MLNLDGKTVLVTGAAGGIGAETARILAGLGARLVLCDRADCTSLAAELRADGAETVTDTFDIRDRHRAERFVTDLPCLDAVVANAGYCPWDDWHDPDWDAAFVDVVDINLRGVINILRPALDRMMAQGHGKAVLVASVAGRMGGLQASPHYVAAKGGVISMTKWMAARAAPHGVNVNAVAPGATETAMVAGSGIDAGAIPLGRLAAPAEIARPIVFLCSDAASYMSGATLDVNGGVYAA